MSNEMLKLEFVCYHNNTIACCGQYRDSNAQLRNYTVNSNSRNCCTPFKTSLITANIALLRCPGSKSMGTIYIQVDGILKLILTVQ